MFKFGVINNQRNGVLWPEDDRDEEAWRQVTNPNTTESEVWKTFQ